MDKNTVIGLCLMFLVIMGFTWLNQPSEEEVAAAKAQQEQAAQAPKQVNETNNATSTVADTLSADDINRLKSTIQLYGRQENAEGETAYLLSSNDANLKLSGDKVSGTINIDGKEVDFENVNSSTDIATRNKAIAALRNAVASYAKSGDFAKCLIGENKTVTLQNDLLKLGISTKGGAITSATILQYDTYRGKGVELFDASTNSFGFVFNTNAQRFDTADYFFTPVEQTDSTVTMMLDLGNNVKWALRYTLESGSYMVKMEVLQQNMNRVIPENIANLDIYWTQRMKRQEQGKMFEERNSAIYYKYSNGDVENLNEGGNDNEEATSNLKWVSFKNQFFSSVLIADNCLTGANMESKVIDKGSAFYSDYLKDLTLNTSVEYSSTTANPANFKIFFGPNKFQLLKSYNKYCDTEDLDLNRLVSLGWALFRWINTYIVIPVFDWLNGFCGNMGITILVLTLLLKIVLFPLSNKSYISQAKMRLLAPDVKKIDEKYPGQENAMKAQQKKMELYSMAGASPFGGCLPMLLQMPFLIAMFTFFPSSIELRGESFLWAQDLSAPDAIFSWTTHIPLISTYFGNHVSLFCLLMTVTNIVYTKITMQSQQNSQMKGMQWMMYLMPIMFLVFFNNYASGLSYYYFLSLLLTIIQNYATRYFVSEEKMRARMAEAAKNPKKKSGFMARLEEAQRQQQAMLAQQQKKNNNGKGRH
ncbi:MAG: membrane protein insertase YidC [Muribaculaceae bacterium]